MGTRSIIGTYDSKKEGKWHGVYHHWDGYPEGVGNTLLELSKTKGLNFIKSEIIEKHPEGWSTINRDWSKKPVNMRKVDPKTRKANDEDTNPPEHYDPKTDGSGFIVPEDGAGACGSEYLYLVHDRGFDVFACYYNAGEHKGQRSVGFFGMGPQDIGKGEEVIWLKLGTVKPTDNEKKLERLSKKLEKIENETKE